MDLLSGRFVSGQRGGFSASVSYLEAASGHRATNDPRPRPGRGLSVAAT
jgi:hypothetical protein